MNHRCVRVCVCVCVCVCVLCVCLSLSYIITRVAPHCVNTLRILHAAYDATKMTCPLVNTPYYPLINTPGEPGPKASSAPRRTLRLFSRSGRSS